MKVRKRELPGNAGFEPDTQVANLHDWIDADSSSFSQAGFPGSGSESGSAKEFYYNRDLKSLSEVLMVPGMTRERLLRIAPYIQASPTRTTRININTAPVPVLVAMGMAEFDAIQLKQERLSEPVTDQKRRQQIGVVYPQLLPHTTQQSSRFSAYIQIRSANATRYAKAVF